MHRLLLSLTALSITVYSFAQTLEITCPDTVYADIQPDGQMMLGDYFSSTDVSIGAACPDLTSTQLPAAGLIVPAQPTVCTIQVTDECAEIAECSFVVMPDAVAPPLSLEVSYQFPFAENATVFVFGEDDIDYQVRIVEEGDDLMTGPVVLQSISAQTVGMGFAVISWPMPTPAVTYDIYARAIGLPGDTSAFVGPIQFTRPIAPAQCGNSMENACEVIPMQDTLPYFTIPQNFMGMPPTTLGTDCDFTSTVAWYQFTPTTPTGVAIRTVAPHYLAVLDSDGTPIFCYEGDCPEVNQFSDPIPPVILDDLTQGDTYFVILRTGFLWNLACSNSFSSYNPLSIQELPQGLSVTLDSPTATISCGEAVVPSSYTISGGCAPYQVDTVTNVMVDDCEILHETSYTVTDDCGAQVTSAVHLITEIDDVAPMIDCSAITDTIFADAMGQFFMPEVTSDALVTDCVLGQGGGQVFIGVITQFPEAGSQVLAGEEVCFAITATDDCGNQAVCDADTDCLRLCYSADCDSLSLRLADGELSISTSCLDAVEPSEPIIISDCGVVASEVTDEVIVSECPIVVERTYTVSDACGATVSVVQTIIIDDIISPEIVCPEPTTVEVPEVDDLAFNPFSVDDAVATDGCDGVTVEMGIDLPDGEFPVGGHTVTYTATDQCGNSVQCTTLFEVDVINSLGELSFDDVQWQVNGDILGVTMPRVSEIDRLQLIDLSGRLIIDRPVIDPVMEVKLPSAEGVYILRLIDSERGAISGRIASMMGK